MKLIWYFLLLNQILVSWAVTDQLYHLITCANQDGGARNGVRTGRGMGVKVGAMSKITQRFMLH